MKALTLTLFALLAASGFGQAKSTDARRQAPDAKIPDALRKVEAEGVQVRMKDIARFRGVRSNQLTGIGFLSGGYHKSHGQFMDGKGSYTVHRPDHWIFEGTGLKQGDEFGGKDSIVGYECDGCEFTMEDGLPVPTGRDGTPLEFIILGTAPAKWHPDDAHWYESFDQEKVGASVLGTYTRGGTVFTCGSTDWAHGLRGRDPIVERITRNVLGRLSQ